MLAPRLLLRASPDPSPPMLATRVSPSMRLPPVESRPTCSTRTLGTTPQELPRTPRWRRLRLASPRCALLVGVLSLSTSPRSLLSCATRTANGSMVGVPQRQRLQHLFTDVMVRSNHQ